MKLQKRLLKFEFDGNNYELNYPTVKQILKFQEELDADENNYEATFNLLDTLGLPRDTSEDMEVSHVTTIVQALTETEKK